MSWRDEMQLMQSRLDASPDGGAAFRAAIAELRRTMDDIGQLYTAHRCPHGLITAWSGETVPGLVEPLCHHCEQCNPGASPLNTEF